MADFSSANGRDISTLSIQAKGGSSSFHGAGYDYLENDFLNAINPFDKAESELVLGTPAIKPTLRRNQFGEVAILNHHLRLNETRLGPLEFRAKI